MPIRHVPVARMVSTVLVSALTACQTAGPGGPPGAGVRPSPYADTTTAVNPPAVPGVDGFSSAVKVGLSVYMSGQVPLDSTGALVGAGDLAAQSRRVFANMAAVVRAARGVPGDVVKLTVYLRAVDPRAVAIIRTAVQEELHPEVPPAVTLVTVSTFPVDGMLLSSDGIAVLRGLFPDRMRDSPAGP